MYQISDIDSTEAIATPRIPTHISKKKVVVTKETRIHTDSKSTYVIDENHIGQGNNCEER